jgi:hypothetical protein
MHHILILGIHHGERSIVLSQVGLEGSKEEFLLERHMGVHHRRRDRRRAKDLNHGVLYGGNLVDLIEKRVERAMLANQGIGRFQGCSPFSVIG